MIKTYFSIMQRLVVLYSTAQGRVAQHSTAQHSTVECSAIIEVPHEELELELESAPEKNMSSKDDDSLQAKERAFARTSEGVSTAVTDPKGRK